MCCRDQLIASTAQSIGPYTPRFKNARIFVNTDGTVRCQFLLHNLSQLLRPLATWLSFYIVR